MSVCVRPFTHVCVCMSGVHISVSPQQKWIETLQEEKQLEQSFALSFTG